MIGDEKSGENKKKKRDKRSLSQSVDGFSRVKKSDKTGFK
jgi:hypothetical protein